MKTIFTILILVALSNTLTVITAFGQTTVVGHASAEVIESVSVSSLAVSNFDISNLQNSTSNTQGLNLGVVKVNSGNNTTCGIVVTPATLTNNNGNSFTIDPLASNSNQAEKLSTVGNQSLSLSGTAQLAQGQEPGKYKGSYSIVFAYN